MPEQSLGQGQTTNQAARPLHIKTMLYLPILGDTAFSLQLLKILAIIELYCSYSFTGNVNIKNTFELCRTN